MSTAINLDDSVANADWLKTTWDLPPYMSAQFLAVVPTTKLARFRQLPVYKNAVAAGLIYDDEWVGDWCTVLPDLTRAFATELLGLVADEDGVTKLAKAKKDNADDPKVTDAKAPREFTQEDVDDMLDAVDDADWALLEDALGSAIEDAFVNGGMVELDEVEDAVAGNLERLVDTRAAAYAEEHAAELVTQISETTRDRLQGMVEDSLSEGWTQKELVEALQDSFAFSENRATTIAITELSDAHIQGRMDIMGQAGATHKVWLLSADHDPASDCDCSANAEEGQIPFDDNWASGDDAPPSHPRAVLEGSTFSAYGALRQMVRARYDGPAITINTGTRQLTVGPHHPMLTRRGFVSANELKEGDELLYDSRAEVGPTTSVSDLKHVPMVEDVFKAFTPRFARTGVAGAAHYFHGDEVAIYGEVDVVRPARGLLTVLDPLGIEQLGKCALVGTDTTALHVAGCRSCQTRFERVFNATLGVVGDLHPSPARSGSKLGPVGAHDFWLACFVRFMGWAQLCTSLFLGELGPRCFQMNSVFGTDTASAFAPLRVSKARPVCAQGVGSIHVARVLSCHKHTFTGYAFDASTDSGLYNSGGFITKNCWCDMAGVYPEDTADTGDDTGDDTTDEAGNDGEAGDTTDGEG